MRTPLMLFVGWLAGLGTVAVAGLAIVEGGLFDATAITPHYPPVAWITHHAMVRSVDVRAARLARPPADPQAIRRGFRLYDAHCATCHGGPGLARAAWVSGMTPDPPYLLDAARRWTPGQLTHLVGKGVKMTGMPAWAPTLSHHQLADLVAFLEALPDVTPADYARLREADGPSAAPPR